jgi:hypothetical protein
MEEAIDILVGLRDAITHPGGRRAYYLDDAEEARVGELNKAIDAIQDAINRLSATPSDTHEVG